MLGIRIILDHFCLFVSLRQTCVKMLIVDSLQYSVNEALSRDRITRPPRNGFNYMLLLFHSVSLILISLLHTLTIPPVPVYLFHLHQSPLLLSIYPSLSTRSYLKPTFSTNPTHRRLLMLKPTDCLYQFCTAQRFSVLVFSFVTIFYITFG